ncbi:hypothetical protein [Pararcticibacter amylolyticus]|uniref:Uncharacterized protein n=1 Tax=Pararcticibacter amylolyticus TaxID=2173175 RepID=A0A2U2PJR9_9SPHI|nr:hypothetical protein [Pararcticibacter amylolyticus]PWG81630.1 hypothetical protein DDR33_04415 [Pararcticibacter amylolyticus]
MSGNIHNAIRKWSGDDLSLVGEDLSPAGEDASLFRRQSDPKKSPSFIYHIGQRYVIIFICYY